MTAVTNIYIDHLIYNYCYLLSAVSS